MRYVFVERQLAYCSYEVQADSLPEAVQEYNALREDGEPPFEENVMSAELVGLWEGEPDQERELPIPEELEGG